MQTIFSTAELQHARAIRGRIIECFERASSPFISEAERKRLLTFGKIAVVQVFLGSG